MRIRNTAKYIQCPDPTVFFKNVANIYCRAVDPDPHGCAFIYLLDPDPHESALFYILDPDPHSEKLLDPDPQKMNADPQP